MTFTEYRRAIQNLNEKYIIHANQQDTPAVLKACVIKKAEKNSLLLFYWFQFNLYRRREFDTSHFKYLFEVMHIPLNERMSSIL